MASSLLMGGALTIAVLALFQTSWAEVDFEVLDTKMSIGLIDVRKKKETKLQT